VLENLVELVGIEPTTSSLRTINSPVHRIRSFKELHRPNPEIGSSLWNVFGTCGRHVVCLNELHGLRTIRINLSVEGETCPNLISSSNGHGQYTTAQGTVRTLMLLARRPDELAGTRSGG
jgi:hypothetical protein